MRHSEFYSEAVLDIIEEALKESYSNILEGKLEDSLVILEAVTSFRRRDCSWNSESCYRLSSSMIALTSKLLHRFSSVGPRASCGCSVRRITGDGYSNVGVQEAIVSQKFPESRDNP